jgi:hypothetical protein
LGLTAKVFAKGGFPKITAVVGSCIRRLWLLMVLSVVGCTMAMGIATCAKSKQEGAVFDDVSFVGVKMLGKFAQTHLVRNVIAS